jgi:hypothetical protein
MLENLQRHAAQPDGCALLAELPKSFVEAKWAKFNQRAWLRFTLHFREALLIRQYNKLRISGLRTEVGFDVELLDREARSR